jgi:hypothetical protein
MSFFSVSPSELIPTPAWFQPLFTAAAVLAILLPPGAIRVAISGAILIALLAQTPYYTSGSPFDDYIFGVSITSTFVRYLDLIVFHIPERDFYRLGEAPQDADGVHTPDVRTRQPWPKGACGKLRHMASLWIANRGIGWNIHVQSIPASPFLPSQ